MINLGDRALASVIVFDFNTHKADGTPITLAGTPVISVYKNSTTEITAGITLTVDYDGRTGMHHVVIDTADAAYATNTNFSVVITTGTVDSVSVIGSVVACFSIGRANVAYIGSTAQTPRDLGNALPAAAPGAKGGVPITDAATGLLLTGYGGATVKNDIIDAPNSTAIAAFKTGLAGLGVYLTGIMATALTETSGYLAAAFKKFFNVATPVSTTESVNQGADNNALLADANTGLVAIANNMSTFAAGDKVDLIDSLKNKSGASGFDRTTDSLEALGEKVPLDAQGTANALKLAPAMGTPASGSVYDSLTKSNEYGSAINDLIKANATGDVAAMKVILDKLNTMITTV